MVLNKKFIQTLDTDVYKTMKIVAKEKGISLQELMRAVVVPDWMQAVSKQSQRGKRRRSH